MAKFNLGEHIINTAFNHIVDNYETNNADCEVVSKFIKKDYSVLEQVTPKELEIAFEYLSLPLDEKPVSFKKTLEQAFDESFGGKLYGLIAQDNQRDIAVIFDNIALIRAQLVAPTQKKLFR